MKTQKIILEAFEDHPMRTEKKVAELDVTRMPAHRLEYIVKIQEKVLGRIVKFKELSE